MTISIHALREEGDIDIVKNWRDKKYFYPRPPRGGRLHRQLSTGQPLHIFLSTPSARRATADCSRSRRQAGISIHALREEGDDSRRPYNRVDCQFLSTPSARRATCLTSLLGQPPQHFYPRPPRGGRPGHRGGRRRVGDFYPRPPRGGRRRPKRGRVPRTHFYPRPPRGGRQYGKNRPIQNRRFLSTPSARRATVLLGQGCANLNQFLSTPSARRATRGRLQRTQCPAISIHALREEGDLQRICSPPGRTEFLSTPSARRATMPRGTTPAPPTNFYPRPPRGGRLFLLLGVPGNGFISIHALREEGDCTGRACEPCQQYFYPRPPRGGRPTTWPKGWPLRNFYPRPPRGGRHCSHVRPTDLMPISIHALREEGDDLLLLRRCTSVYFYPRPPRGGRLCDLLEDRPLCPISIHALREEGDRNVLRTFLFPVHFYPRPPRGGRPGALCAANHAERISIHALREEGDRIHPVHGCSDGNFYPRPPRGGRRYNLTNLPTVI